MYFNQIADNVFAVGVLNPNLRVFDIVMKTDFGTTYNSYFIKGSEKTALIDTVHKTYINYLIKNLECIEESIKIDYIIMNHNEPDHSGSIAKLVELMPDITVLTSQAGAIYLKNITNVKDLKVQVVKDNDEISLGDKTLKFINAPFLHWPDSMFTYLPEDKMLFSCDFLGAHYCEPELFDKCINYRRDYEASFLGYYEAIFAPFKPHVLKGLEKIKDLDIDMACPSHGPILTKGGLLEQAKARYLEWSTPVVRENKVIPLFYSSAYGNTRLLAENIAIGVKKVHPSADVKLYDIIDHDMTKLGALLNSSDAFLIGTPTLNRDAVPPVYMLLAHVDAINIAKRPTAVFGSYGWSGEGVPNVRGRLTALKTKLFEEDFKVVFVPSNEDLEAAQAFGERFANTI